MTESQWKNRIEWLHKEYDPLRHFELFDALVTEDGKVGSWEDFQRWMEPFSATGCFRGHRDRQWNLVTTLDRALDKTISIETDDIHSSSRFKINPEENEAAILREFKRAAHHYLDSTPEPDQVIDWLALMQHYGAPTRLLDWTRSPYVALYFAMQADVDVDAALWAIDLSWFEQRSHLLLREHDSACPNASDFDGLSQNINKIPLEKDNPYVVINASPLRLNERMLAQQGLLLCCLRHDVSFSACVLRMLFHPLVIGRQVVSKIVVEKERRMQFLEELRRMNIHNASLFPGLDGFARSLAVNLEIDVGHQIADHKRKLVEEMRLYRSQHRNQQT